MATRKKKKKNIFSEVLCGVLATIILAVAVLSGVGFGIYGSDVAQWFTTANAESPVEEEPTPDPLPEPEPEPAKSTPLVVGDKIALWEGAEGKSLYVNTDLNVWNEFYLAYKDIAETVDVVFFPFFAFTGENAPSLDWGTLEGNKQLFPMYFVTGGDGSCVLMLLANYDYIVGFNVNSETGEYATLVSDFVSEDGRVDFTSRVEKDLPDRANYVVEYVGWEGYILEGDEIALDENGNPVTLENYLDVVGMSHEKVSTEWVNRLFSTTPFID